MLAYIRAANIEALGTGRWTVQTVQAIARTVRDVLVLNPVLPNSWRKGSRAEFQMLYASAHEDNLEIRH